jgi:hypothetical protein
MTPPDAEGLFIFRTFPRLLNDPARPFSNLLETQQVVQLPFSLKRVEIVAASHVIVLANENLG